MVPNPRPATNPSQLISQPPAHPKRRRVKIIAPRKNLGGSFQEQDPALDPPRSNHNTFGWQIERPSSPISSSGWTVNSGYATAGLYREPTTDSNTNLLWGVREDQSRPSPNWSFHSEAALRRIRSAPKQSLERPRLVPSSALHSLRNASYRPNAGHGRALGRGRTPATPRLREEPQGSEDKGFGRRLKRPLRSLSSIVNTRRPQRHAREDSVPAPEPSTASESPPGGWLTKGPEIRLYGK